MKINLPQLAKRTAGNPNPHVVGNAAVRRYLEVAENARRRACCD